MSVDPMEDKEDLAHWHGTLSTEEQQTIMCKSIQSMVQLVTAATESLNTSLPSCCPPVEMLTHSFSFILQET